MIFFTIILKYCQSMQILVISIKPEDKDKIFIGYILFIIRLYLMGYSIAPVIGVFTTGNVLIEILHS